MKPLLFILLFSTTLCFRTIGTELSPVLQQQIDSMISEELAQHAFPGAAFLVGDKTGIRYARNYGTLSYDDKTAVCDSTLYDLASCTKSLATSFVMMRLYDQQRFTLDQTVAHFLPQFAGTSVGTLSLQELLTHTSGLRPIVCYPLGVKPPKGERLFSGQPSEQYPYQVDQNLYMRRDVEFDTSLLCTAPRLGYRHAADSLYVNPAIDTLLTRQIINSFRAPMRGKYQYNDTNLYLIGLIAEQLTGSSLSELVNELYSELDCHETGYTPLQWSPRERIAPTETDYLLRRGAIWGYVHDELAALNGGVSGNAGLFSTSHDIAHFCQMMLNDGQYNGRQIISAETIQLFTSTPFASQGIYRTLGFDKRDPNSALGGEGAFGHTGFTGTIFWIDTHNDLFMVLLTNRVSPSRCNNRLNTSLLRSRLWTLLKESLSQAPSGIVVTDL